jgi:RNA polymerase subunit RPABC4/transcription elongation factor Spt4
MLADIITLLSNRIFSIALISYAFIFWLALIFWVAIDVSSRSNNWFVRFGCILLAWLPVLGFVLYLIVRPQSTLEEEKLHGLEEKILASQSQSFICPNCLELVRDDFVFCPGCGINIKRECPSCQRLLEIVWTQCPYCGIALARTALPTIKETPPQLPNGNRFFGVFRKFFNTAAVPSEVKRKRGRPRKEKPIEPEVKRPRGRPRKNVPELFN